MGFQQGDRVVVRSGFPPSELRLELVGLHGVVTYIESGLSAGYPVLVLLDGDLVDGHSSYYFEVEQLQYEDVPDLHDHERLEEWLAS